MPILGIIGGSGYASWGRPSKLSSLVTPYGEPSSKVGHYQQDQLDIVFIARHGNPHQIPPHEVNYRANIWAMAHNQVDFLLGLNAVGGISDAMEPGRLAVPDQLIDYSWGRKQTFSNQEQDRVQHIEFARPFHEGLRGLLLQGAARAGIAVIDGGTYAVTQGPRLETAAEILRMKNDGCDLVGMTAMPEAALARELDLNYASLCIVSNRAAGLTDQPVNMKDIDRLLADSRPLVEALIGALQAA